MQQRTLEVSSAFQAGMACLTPGAALGKAEFRANMSQVLSRKPGSPGAILPAFHTLKRKAGQLLLVDFRQRVDACWASNGAQPYPNFEECRVAIGHAQALASACGTVYVPNHPRAAAALLLLADVYGCMADLQKIADFDETQILPDSMSAMLKTITDSARQARQETLKKCIEALTVCYAGDSHPAVQHVMSLLSAGIL
jgi:hypothetical protein